MALLARPEDGSIELDLHKQHGESPTANRQLSVRKCQDYLPFRTLRALSKDPAAFLFIISLFIFAICMPLLGLYLKQSENLLDLDTMKIWNSFLGQLYRKHFGVLGVFNRSSVSHSHCSIGTSPSSFACNTICVRLKFDVSKHVFENSNISVLAGNFSGTEMKTAIKDVDGDRVDSAINLHIILDIGKARNICSSSRRCSVKGYVFITAPKNATGFGDLLSPSPEYRKPPERSVCSWTDSPRFYRNLTSVYNMTLSRYKSLVKTTGTQIRKHELILIYLSQEDQEIAARRIYKASVIFVGLALAFLIGLSCTSTGSQQQSEHHNNYHNE